MKRWILLGSFVLFSAFSKASISLEPYLGYGLGYFYLSNPTAYTGLSLGSRFGYSQWGFMLGVDASYVKYTPFSRTSNIPIPVDRIRETAERGLNQTRLLKAQTHSQLAESNANPYDVWMTGPSVVFGLPLIIDAYASVIWAVAVNESERLQGAGFKVGASYLSLPFVSVNFELQTINYFSCYSISEGRDCSPNAGNLGQMYMVLVYLSSPINTGFL